LIRPSTACEPQRLVETATGKPFVQEGERSARLIGYSTEVALNARNRGMGLGEKGEEGIEERNDLTVV
jgi:hypothetical protein